jgi:uncharacterized membrane protein
MQFEIPAGYHQVQDKQSIEVVPNRADAETSEYRVRGHKRERFARLAANPEFWMLHPQMRWIRWRPRPPRRRLQCPPSAGISPDVAGALSYLFGVVSEIIFLVIDPFKSDRIVRFHAFESIFSAWAGSEYGSLGRPLWCCSRLFPGAFSPYSSSRISLAFTLGSLGYWFFLMYEAYSGQQHRIPLIGRLAEQQTNK